MNAAAIRRFGKQDLTNPGRPQPGNARFLVHGLMDRRAMLEKRRKRMAKDLQTALQHVLAGHIFAEPGSRDDVLWRLLCSIAALCPELNTDEVVAMFETSIKVMAVAHPADHLTLGDVREKYERARQARPVTHLFKRGDEAEIAENIVRDLTNESPVPPLSDLGTIYLYDPSVGVWREVGRPELSQRIQSYATSCRIVGSEEKPPRALHVSANMVRGAVALANDRVANHGFFDAARPGITFENGRVVIQNGTAVLQRHSPENRALTALPFPYVAGLTHPLWDEFLYGVFGCDADWQRKVECLQEFVGACLFGIAIHYAKAVILLGEGRNGKSVFLKIISALVPKAAVCHVPPHLWEKDDYRRAELAGKLLNIVFELPRADVLKGEAFKAVVAGDEMQGRRIYKEPFDFQPRAGHMFAANALPPVDDLSRAFWERVLVIGFNRVFQDHERIKNLDQIIIRSELCAIAAWAVDGARRLLARGDTGSYTLPPSHRAALDAWKLNADQVAQWRAERTVAPAKGGSWLSASGAYADYGAWAHENGHHKLAANKFGERLRQLGVPSKKPKSQTLYELELVTKGFFHRP